MMPDTVELPVAKRNDVTVKMDKEVVAEAKMVASSRDQTLAEYLSELIRPLVQRDLAQEMMRRIHPRSPKGKGETK
jgi:hypothetical protein